LQTVKSVSHFTEWGIRKVKPKTLKIIIIALLLAATPTLVLNLVTTTKVYATEDVNPPVLHDIWVTPSVINDGEKVTFYANVTDDLSGVEVVDGLVESPSGKNKLFIGEYNSSSGLWEGNVTIPQYTENGTWILRSLRCSDLKHNQREYYYGVDFDTNFTVISLTPDITPPTLNDIWVTPTMINVGESIEIYANITDDLSGAIGMICILRSPSGQNELPFFPLYNASSGLYELEVEFLASSWFLETGKWTVQTVECSDAAGNQIQYDYGADYVADFTVLSIADVTPPVLHDVWVLPSTVNDGETVTVYVNVTDDISGTDIIFVYVLSPTENQWMYFYPSYNSTSQLWEDTQTVPEHAENGVWKVERVECRDKVTNYKLYYYDTDYTADFTVTSAPVCDIWSSDVLGNVKNCFYAGDSVYVTVPEAGLTVSLYVVADKSTWNDGDPLTDVSPDGVETLTLNSGQGTQTIQICGAPLAARYYDIVMDVDRDGVFDAELDCVDDLEIAGFFVIPEVPFGAIMASLSMLVALAAFIGVKRSRHNSQSQSE
jgi:hypothetical protein